MKNKKLLQAMENFMAERVNDIGGSDTVKLIQTNDAVKACADRLTASLTPEQTKLWNEYELANALLEGETKNEYYKNGVKDSALMVIMVLGGADDED